MTLQDFVELLRSGAYGCGMAASESWGGTVGQLLGDEEDLNALASEMESGVRVWLEMPDGLCKCIAGEPTEAA